MVYNFVYLAPALVFLTGIFITLTSDNYLRKVIGLSIFQSSVLLFYVALGKLAGGIVPLNISDDPSITYSSPLPHVLMLTAIVVGFATSAVALSMVLGFYNKVNSISENDVEAASEQLLSDDEYV